MQKQAVEEGAQVFELKISEEFEMLTPPYTDQQFKALVDSLREHGQLLPGLVNQHGVILDAYHRYRGCKKLGIPFRYKIEHFNSKADEIL